MKHVSELVSAPLDNSNVSNSSSSNIDTVLITQLFIRFNNIWPGCIEHRWKSPQAIQAAKIEWSRGLGHIETSLLTAALNAAEREYPKYPPTLPEFKKLVKMAQQRQNLDQKRLPKKKMSYESVKPMIDKLREKIK